MRRAPSARRPTCAPADRQEEVAPRRIPPHQSTDASQRLATTHEEAGTLEPIIQLRGVTKSFGSHTVLEDISFDIPRNRISAIMGPSGTGKSVLLKTIIGLLRPDRGEIWIDGEETVRMRERDLYRVRRKFGVLFQDGALFGSLDLYDNIAFPLREHTRKSEGEIRRITMEKASLVGLVDHLRKFPGEVSGGMKKRAGLARALALDPEIVFFDEPDSGLDPVRVAYLDELVRKIQEETGATFTIITHNIPSVMRTADFVAVLFRSGLVRFASTQDMITCDDHIIRQFMAGRAGGPIGMDELATERTEVENELVERAAARDEASRDRRELERAHGVMQV
ncbi:ATP-binding cassette domain-containing protein [Iamia majanohamensis]|uniref:ATP-binding cassette domain-containing protein n=1 Tax=Iamia majanohamensis TaxID=467976 RepID=A0AAE9YBI2_9ACTN|nr:ATP-binding cassette domain-containing protein [Iamia majanohamensis]WCO65006.1 ATP-binding cassette domain-containing protein [Iamia majanohamensis]